MNNWKVGDEVEVIKKGQCYGMKGTITKVDIYSGNIIIKSNMLVLRVKNNMIKKVEMEK